jgi:hypothetical protein
MKDKHTFRKGELVKRTKSAQLAKLLEAAGWQRETSGGVILPKLAPALIVPDAEVPAPKAAKGAKAK